MNFNLKIIMTSDWHIGSGSGRGEIDSVVQRDHSDLPYIPAKTLTGILRDGCEQVAQALDNNQEQGQWHDWINFLFGDQPALAKIAIEAAPRPAIVSIRSAYFEKKLQDTLTAKPQLKNAIAFTKAGVAIDPKTGSAKEKYLRFEEVVRVGAILESIDCCLDFSGYSEISDEIKKVSVALLRAGTKMTERLGGKRRRGNGNCSIEIMENSQFQNDQSAFRWLQKAIENETIPNPPKYEREELNIANSQYPNNSQAETQKWWSIPLKIETKSPVILPKRTVGNVVECLDYIPGRYFLGHLHRTIGKMFDLNQAIARGEIIITNATISIDGKASRPTPFCLFGEKLDGGLGKGRKVYNRFQEDEPANLQLKGERGGYLGLYQGRNLPDHQSITFELNTHNTIRDDVQRPTSDVGGVYSYQAIPKGKTLQAELRIPDHIKRHLDQTKANWYKELRGRIRIGQSKKDQYGAVELTSAQLREISDDKTVEDLLFVWFLSDVLLRDQRLNSTTDPEVFRKALEHELNVQLKERNDPQRPSLMMRSQRNESWQVRWGLPRPTMLGWQAGSCVVYEVEGTIDPQKLAELEAKGIGDRRVEGYGQICFNDPLLTAKLSTLERKEPEPSSDCVPPKPISDDQQSFDYARLIEMAAWRKVIENKALAIASDPEERKKILGLKIIGDQSHPTMSQIGSLRSTIRRLQSFKDKNKVISWINALKSISNRREKWEKTDNSLGKIEKIVADQEEIWSKLKDIPWDDLTMTIAGRNELKQLLWAEAVKTLVDAIIRGHKRDLEKTQEAA